MNLFTQKKLFNAIITNNKSTGYYDDLLELYFIKIPNSINRQNAIDLARKYGTNIQNAVATFYDSKKFVETAEELTLKVHQILHYMSTYGEVEELRNDGEVFSLNNKDLIEIVKTNIREIRTITLEEAIEKVSKIVSTNIALNSDDVKEIHKFIMEHNIILEDIKNRELELLYLQNVDYPIGLDRMVRLCNFILVNNTTYIKKIFLKEFKFYKNITSMEERIKINNIIFRELSLNFNNAAKDANRHRKVLMLLKYFCDKKTKTLINRVLRASKTNAVPRKFTKVERFFELSIKEQLDLIPELSISKAVQLYKANKSRKEDNFAIFTIRNGKRYLKEDKQFKILSPKVEKALKDYIDEFVLTFDFSLPENLDFALPSTYRDMVAHLPNCTKITLPKKAYSVGIYWDKRADVDIHGFTDNSHIGWNASYSKGNITYSGDMTDINKNGYAAEYITFGNGDEDILFEACLYRGNIDDVKLTISEVSDDVDYFVSNIIYDLLVKVESNAICNVFIDRSSSEEEIYIYLLSAANSYYSIPVQETNIKALDVIRNIVKNQFYIRDLLNEENEVIDLETFDASILLGGM